VTDESQCPASRSQWTAEVAVTPELAADLVREQFPGLGAQRAEILETGWDNTACVVDSQWLFRFPRREIALAGIRREIAILPQLAPRLPLPIPVPDFAGQPSARFPWPFWGARLLPGGELAESGLPDSRRSAAAIALGHFLRSLHEPALVSLVGSDLTTDPMKRASAPLRAVRARRTMEGLVQSKLVAADSAVDSLLDRAERSQGADHAETSNGGSGLVVSHGDLHLRHLLVDGDGIATGVIDWGDMCLADPAVDLSIAYAAFAGQPRADLLTAYDGVIDARRELAARVLAVSICAALAEYAAAEGRAMLLRESVAGLRRAVAA
jgi:aminoglycoside phosphotransferase (APT) family kinase protein